MGAEVFFNKNLVFRFSEFKHFMGNRKQGVTEKNCYMTLYNYCKKGRLTHVRRSLYIVNSGNPHEGTSINPFLIAGKATDDATLVYHTALESHGAAYTDFNEHTYLSSRKGTLFSFEGQRYRAVYTTQVHQNDMKGMGVETVVIQGIKIRRTTLERTLVDVLDRPDLSGGWEEVIRSLDRIAIFDVSATVDYALLLNRASIVAKLGYFLDNVPGYLEIDSAVIERLLSHIPKQPYYISRSATAGKGTYIKKWQIIVPDYLHKRQWEEPENDSDF